MRAGKRYGRVIELLVVIAIIPMILIILAVALPGVTNDGRYAREMAAAKAIATIHTAESQYYSRYGRYATSLALLGPPASGSPGPGRPRVNRQGSGFGRKGRLQIRLAADSDRLRLIGHSHRLRPFRHAHLLFGLEARRSAARNWPSPTMACRRNPASKCATRPSSDRFRAATGCFTPRVSATFQNSLVMERGSSASCHTAMLHQEGLTRTQRRSRGSAPAKSCSGDSG